MAIDRHRGVVFATSLLAGSLFLAGCNGDGGAGKAADAVVRVPVAPAVDCSERIVHAASQDDGLLPLDKDLQGRTAAAVNTLILSGKESAAAGKLRDAETAFLLACRSAQQVKGNQLPLADAHYQLGRLYAQVATPQDAPQRGKLLERAQKLYAASLAVYHAEKGATDEKTRFARQGLDQVHELAGGTLQPLPQAQTQVASAGTDGARPAPDTRAAGGPPVAAVDEQARAAEQARLQAEARAREQAAQEAKAREQAALQAQAQARAAEQARIQAEIRAREQAGREAQAQAQAQAAEQARLQAEARARAREHAAQQARAQAAEQARLAAQARESEQAAKQARVQAAEQARLQAEAKAREQAAQQAAARAAEQARLRAEAQAREQARLQAEAQGREQARLQAEAQAREQARVRAEAQAKVQAREQAEARAKEQQARARPQEQERVAAAAPAAPPARRSSPSFDCAKARSTTEKLICADEDLARQDRELGGMHARAKAAAADKRAFQRRSDQEWAEREANCRDRECLQRWYAQRRAELADAAERPAARPAQPEARPAEPVPQPRIARTPAPAPAAEPRGRAPETVLSGPPATASGDVGDVD